MISMPFARRAAPSKSTSADNSSTPSRSLPRAISALVASAGASGVDDVRVLRTKDLLKVCRLPKGAGYDKTVDLARVLPDGESAIVEFEIEAVRLRLRTCEVEWTTPQSYSKAIAIAPDGRTMVMGQVTGFATAFDLKSGRSRGFFGSSVRAAQEVFFPTSDIIAVKAPDLFGQRSKTASAWSLSFWSLSSASLVAAGRDGGRFGAMSQTASGQIVLSEDIGLCGDHRTGIAFQAPATLDDYAAGERRGLLKEAFDALPKRPWPPVPGGEVALCAPHSATTRAGFDAARGVMWGLDWVPPTEDALSLVDSAKWPRDTPSGLGARGQGRLLTRRVAHRRAPRPDLSQRGLGHEHRRARRGVRGAHPGDRARAGRIGGRDLRRRSHPNRGAPFARAHLPGQHHRSPFTPSRSARRRTTFSQATTRES